MLLRGVVCFFASVLCLHNVRAQILTYDIELGDLYKMQEGIGWPPELHIVEGLEAHMKLASTIENQQTCQVTTPEGATFNVNSPPNNRYESWTECGIRLKNVEKQDYGRWRLSASSAAHSITGWVQLYVKDDVNQYTGSPITLHDGQTHTEVNLTTLENLYCVVTQPFTESTLVPGHCSVTLDRTTRAVQGNWHILLGLPGRVTELQVDRSVSVESDRLDVGYVRSTNPNKLNLYCNILHTSKNITFCRFQKTTEQAGYNVIDGLSDGSHSYYGEGFAKKHCGVTIENPTDNDDGTWRCTVGVQEWEGTEVVPRVPLQALLRVVAGRSSRGAVRVDGDSNEGRELFIQANMTVTIHCTAEASLSYCWFQHPNGTQFTPVPKLDDDQLFWYDGESLSAGHCGIAFTHVTEDDGGVWTCHMGPRDIGTEITDTVTVRVTGPLAARRKEVTAIVGTNATLYCHSSNGNRPLDYCRFLSPNNDGVSVDSTITYDNRLLGRYYFTPGRDLNYGDCSLSITPVEERDAGQWTCAAVVDNEIFEARDTIVFYVQQPAPRFNAGIIGMSIGLAALVILLIGAIFYKYGKPRLPTIRLPWRNRVETHTLEERGEVQSHRSSSSSTSEESISSSEVQQQSEQQQTQQQQQQEQALNAGDLLGSYDSPQPHPLQVEGPAEIFVTVTPKLTR